MAERYFNRQEAEELLPAIQSCLGQARELKQRMEKLDVELSQAAARIMLLGGSIPPHADLAKKKAEREKAASRVLEAVNKIQETGCLVKDLDEGLIDFPTLLKGEEVYLCWKLGEKRIGYWHGIEEGFAGRKPLDDSTTDEPPSGRQQVQ